MSDPVGRAGHHRLRRDLAAPEERAVIGTVALGPLSVSSQRLGIAEVKREPLAAEEGLHDCQRWVEGGNGTRHTCLRCPFVSPPGVFRAVSEDATSFLDGQQRVVLTEFPDERYIGEDLSYQICIGA
jgi:hypothetical protein